MKKMFLILVSISILALCIILVSATRLPIVGGDSDGWGAILNDYLSKIAGSDATTLNQTMVNGTNIYASSINTTHLIDGTVTDMDISDTINLTLGEKITFNLGEVIDNIVDGWITITGNLNLTNFNLTVDNAEFNGGWQNNGLSIIEGDIYAQTGYFYNITSLNVTKQNLTILDDLTVQDNTFLNKNLTVDTDTLFVDSDNHNVGIGTTSPTERLHVGYAHIGFTSLTDPGALTATVGIAGNVDIGTHYYRVAYVTDDGESLLGTVTDPIVVSDSTKQIDLTNIPVSSNPFVTSRKIYRTKVASASYFYLVATIDDNIATTYTDNMPESSFPTAYKYIYGLEDTSAGRIFRDNLLIFSAGEQNTLMGYAAGTNLEIDAGAFANTYVGGSAGQAATTGSRNTGIGFQTLTGLKTGTQNVAVGSQSLRVGTTISYNTVIGHTAGFYTTANYNTFIGRSAGYYNTAGAYNVMIGASAGILTKTGSENTIIGTSAGVGTSGQSYSRNTFLGFGSGQLISTGSDNVFLGYKSGYSETSSNKLYISNTNTTTPLIYGEFDNNILSFNADVGIGTTTPSSTLEVVGDINASGGRVYDKTGYAGIPGEIKMYGGATAPTGWLLCNGTNYSRTGTYADLYTVLGTTYGNNSASDFKIPDFTDKFARGNTAGATGGNDDTPAHTHTDNFTVDNHTLTVAQMPSHSHDLFLYDTAPLQVSGLLNTAYEGTHVGGPALNNIITPEGGGTGHNHGLSGSITSSGSVADGNMPAYLGVNFIIKY